ncbi:MAG: nitroreductase family protein [Pseudomonadota bacterium]
MAEPDASPRTGSIDHAELDAMLSDAAMAPFHFPHPDHEEGSSAVPWRVNKLDGAACRKLAQRAEEEGLTIGGVARMLRAADALALTWFTPEGEVADESAFVGSLRNMEHIAAAGAFSQSLLLRATAVGYTTYWSSGGVLRDEPIRQWLDVTPGDVMVGALFIFPAEPQNAEVKTGRWRDERGAISEWSTWSS